MSTTSRWIVPCVIGDSQRKTDILSFDLTTQLKRILKNKVWERKFEYAYPGISEMDSDSIQQSTVTILPQFSNGEVDLERIPKFIEKNCGKIPPYLKVDSYKDWNHQYGVIIFEIKYAEDSPHIPLKRDITKNLIPDIDLEFNVQKDKQIGVLKELAYLFLFSLHLTYPTRSAIIREEPPHLDGFYFVQSKKRKYASHEMTESFMHPILFEEEKESFFMENLNKITSIWHLNLWPIKRYLKGVESNRITMDHLLDLLFALEGLFKKNTSSQYIKLFCTTLLCSSKREASTMKNKLDTAFRIRNNIAHGGHFYSIMEKVNVGNTEMLAQELYFSIKHIVQHMISLAISKVLNNEGLKHLRFNSDDFLNVIFDQ